jgi:hypothetical protein
MRLQKHLQGFVVFLTILIGIICIYEYVNWPFGKVPRVEVPASVTEPVTYEASAVDYDVRLISLDFINGKVYTTLTLKLQPGRPAPDKLLVKTDFYVPNGADNPAWTSTADVQVPVAAGNQVEVTAVAECDWCAWPDTPKAGYFANVYVPAGYVRNAFVPNPLSSIPVEAAVPVVVQAERKPRR